LEAIRTKAKIVAKKKLEINVSPAPKQEDLHIVGSTASEQAKNMITKILTTQGALRKPVLLSMFSYQQSRSVEGNKLGQLSNQDVEAIIDDLCLPLQSLLVLKSMGNPVLDQYRYTVISLFEKKSQLRKTELMSAWESDVGNTPNTSMYSRIMQEVATARAGGSWVLK
jgi:hypothetical protein